MVRILKQNVIGWQEGIVRYFVSKVSIDAIMEVFQKEDNFYDRLSK